LAKGDGSHLAWGLIILNAERAPLQFALRLLESWWMRSRKIRTAASIPVDIPVAETRVPPVYQQIAMKAARLGELGMTYPEIGQKLGVDRWTIGKAVRWLQRQRDVGSTYSNSSID
jgi:hypothetical protein